jgi:sarcosine oxidase
MRYDVAVVGLGGMGSAILAHCAARGALVIGLEQFAKGHELGSSHGKSRMIRHAYFEDPAYVPLLQRASELWEKLEQTSKQAILRRTGVLTVGEPATEIMAGTRRAAAKHDLPIELWSASEVAVRYPTLRLLPDEVALFEKEAGVLDPERAIVAHLQVAQSGKAEVRFNVTMQSWGPVPGGFEMVLSDGSAISTCTLVLSLGAWFKPTLESLGVPIRVQRNVQAWFAPSSNAYHAARFPAFLLDRRGLPAPLYGFPDFGHGMKAAFHGCGAITDAPHVDRGIDPARDVEPLAHEMEKWMPGATARFLEAKACMYTLTPDQHFVIDRHPDHSGLILCGGFSGHGFKFATVVGEICADLALEEGTRHAIEFLSLRRFAKGAEQVKTNA